MAGKFNPFQSKQDEVVRRHQVDSRKKALKILEKLQRKRPYVWAEIESTDAADAEQRLNGLSGEVSVALFVGPGPNGDEAIPGLDALVTRLWKNFNKLHIIQQVEPGEGSATRVDDE